MNINLPKPIGDYFSADRADSEAVANCFTDNAIVKDENHTYRGRAAIKQWKIDSSKKFSYSVEPFCLVEKAGKTIVSSKVTGNFPGSPLNLNYIFSLEGDRIAMLEITL
ncbi:nuclear transport factor 2 family protein [Arsukibacterium sp.]|uniref:nuclear transport factor 2 family protein n=1 Tax=Arsukibacterium sp. TaxID=1977258 RepID=UPI001BD35687|nr:nuclear transport factor 2 family protein [Arsukibacterium sp.]